MLVDTENQENKKITDARAALIAAENAAELAKKLPIGSTPAQAEAFMQSKKLELETLLSDPLNFNRDYLPGGILLGIGIICFFICWFLLGFIKKFVCPILDDVPKPN